MGEIILPRDKNLRQRSVQLRKEATKEEQRLWYDFLRTYPVRFNRQRIIGEYITDFFCRKANLVIELDGAQHFEENAKEYDEVRTQYLNSLGIEVLRFTNREVNKSFREVCVQIDNAVKEQMKKAPLERSCQP